MYKPNLIKKKAIKKRVLEYNGNPENLYQKKRIKL